jgi:DNA-binding NtrC family response regulator/tetratricopeptide (TPR) repeat protein
LRADLWSLISAGRIGDARKALAALPSLNASERLAYCVVRAASGDETEAFAAAVDLASRDVTPQVLVEALVLAARVDYAKGRWVDAANRFLRAKQVATAAGDKGLIARATGCHTEALLHFVSLESAISNVRNTRHAAVAAGAPEALFDYHLMVAEIESRLGHSNRAARELELADVFLKAAPSLLREARWHFARCNVAAGVGRWREAFESATSASRVAGAAGASVVAELSLNNLAHAQVAVGRLPEARDSIAKLASSQRRSGQVLLTRSSVALNLALAEDDLDSAAAIDETAAKVAEEFQGGNNPYGFWYRVARIHYLIRAGQPDLAASLADDAISRLAGSPDRSLLDRLRTAGATAFGSLGDAVRAIDLVGQVALGPLGRVPELFAEGEAALATIRGLSDLQAREHLQRAGRIYAHVGHETGRAATERLERLKLSLRSDGDDLGLVVRASAALMDLASSPMLMGQEAMLLARQSGSGVPQLLATKRPVDGVDAAAKPRSGLAPTSVTIPLGDEQGTSYELEIEPANDTSARITLLAIQRLVASARALHAAQIAESERSALWPDPLPEQQLGFVCASESMLDLMRVTRRVASSIITVLITGETGTGKELLARAVHQCSPRSTARFIPFNCTAVPRDMLDSQLFGYKRGAFTGAQEAFPGVIRGAAGGTLFLDEIGEIGLDVQPKLLRFLESSEVHPLGESSPVTVDVRVVAATNADLDRLMAEGKFREDLFYRLNVVKLTIPPLRERREEIPLLLDHFLERTMKEAGKTGIRLAESTSEFLLLYAWPGNVRELANEVRRVVALGESGSVVMPEHLSPKIAATRRTVPVAERPLEPTELVVRRDQPLNAAVEHVERALIQDALRSTANVELAAKRLGLSRKGLYLKRQRLKIDD